MPCRRRWGKAPEVWSTPRRCAPARPVKIRASVLDCGGPPPLWLYGDNFSQCGRWSRFQRTSAASLVSANRNSSVGDSTWPSQKNTLALTWWRMELAALRNYKRSTTARTTKFLPSSFSIYLDWLFAKLALKVNIRPNNFRLVWSFR